MAERFRAIREFAKANMKPLVIGFAIGVALGLLLF